MADIYNQIIPNLDLHLVFPILDFLQTNKVLPENEVTKNKLELLQRTRMVDFAKEEFEKNGVSVPQSLSEKRANLVAEHKTLSAKTAEIRKVLENAELVNRLRTQNSFTLDFLSKNHGINAAMVDDLFRFARFQFDAGNYSSAGEYLTFFRLLAPADHPELLGALWGKLASEILLQDWTNAAEDLQRVRDAIESSKSLPENAALQLTHRAWLLHWALFVFFSTPDAGLRYLELSTGTESALGALQISAPHLLRYVVVAHVCLSASSQRRLPLPLTDLVRIIDQEPSTHSDPVVRFVHCLFSEYDFERAQQQLRLAEKALQEDYFLKKHYAAQFVENARLMLFRSYCKIHQCLDLNMLAGKLSMGPAEAESWIVNLIRNELDAKIDSAKNQIVFNPVTTPIYQKIIERAQSLSTQTALLQSNVQKLQKRN